MKAPRKPGIAVQVQKSSLALPGAVRAIMHLYEGIAVSQRMVVIEGAVPKSLNHQYIRRSRTVMDLHPDVKAFRDRVRTQAMHFPEHPAPISGATVALALFFSPLWITQKKEIRKMDVDNMLKGLLDAYEKAFGVEDERNWATLGFKIFSPSTRTVLYLYDMGTGVASYG